MSPSTANADGPATPVTLITGDVVQVRSVDGKHQVAEIERPKDASQGVFVDTIDNDLYVIPEEARPLIDAGRLDRRLFDVTKLISQKYDDRRRSTIPLILTYKKNPTNKVRGVRQISGIKAGVTAPAKKSAREFWRDVTTDPNVRKVWLDGQVRADLAQSVPQVRAPEAWANGLEGKGVTVAVLDTGVDATHPDLVDRIAGTKSFVPDDVADKDEAGHGTHVTSTVLGSGAASGGTNKGVAPGAKAIVGKVLGDDGYGQDSWVLEGMEWAAKSGAKVVNMSLGDPTPSDGTDPISLTLDELSKQYGTLFVVSAGNRGAPGTIGSPSAAAEALTVGSVTKQDELSYFSSQGPVKNNTQLKPDIAAPGSSIMAARSQQSNGSGYYVGMSGTSMASPHVAGAAAILAQQHPDWTPTQLKNALMSTSKQLPAYNLFEAGVGRLDVANATGDLHATGTVYFGFYDWPHTTDPVVNKTITYTNSGATPLTLALEAPAGFELSAQTVTVPAQGKASVDVKVDPNTATIGNHLGQLVAKGTDGQVVAHTGVGFVKEDERYTLNLKVLDRSGKPGTATIGIMREGDIYPSQGTVDSELSLRLPPGNYAVLGWEPVAGQGPDRGGMALLGDPEIVLDRNTNVVLDARQAKLARVSGIDRPVENRQRRMVYYRKFAGGPALSSSYIPTVKVSDLYIAPTEKVTNGTFEYATRYRLGAPSLSLTAGGTKVENLPQAGSTMTDLAGTVPVVFAGEGAPSDYEGRDVKGKIALVERSDEVSPTARSEAAIAAGAKILLTVNDKDGKLAEWVGPENGDRAPIMVATLTKRVGDPLISLAKTGRLSMRVKAIAYTPYIYDLVDSHHGRISEDQTYRFDEDRDARVKSVYYGFKAVTGGGFRYDLGPHTAVGAGFREYESYPRIREEWVSVEPGLKWHETHTVGDDAFESRGGLDTYRAGRTTTSPWFAPVLRPKMGTGGWGPDRRGDQMAWNVAQWSDSGHDHSGFMSVWSGTPGVTTTSKLYQGDTLIATTKGQDIQRSVPSRERLPYKVVQDATRPAEDWRTSTKLHSEWTFNSQYREQIYTLPALFLDFDVDTNLAGDAPAGSWQRIGLSAAFKPGALDTGKVTKASLALSFDDGTTWTPLSLVRQNDGSWSARVRYPRTPGTFVSVRATANDDQGNSVSQEIVRAYGLR